MSFTPYAGIVYSFLKNQGFPIGVTSASTATPLHPAALYNLVATSRLLSNYLLPVVTTMKPIRLIILTAVVALAFLVNPSNAAAAEVVVKEVVDEAEEPAPVASTTFKRELAAGSMSMSFVPYDDVVSNSLLLLMLSVVCSN